jgi:similar to stage IV sporulation protein
MVRIDFFVLGYRKLKIPPESLSEITSILLRSSIISQIDSSGNILVREYDYSKIHNLLQGRNDILISDSCGIWGAWLKLENKFVYAFALIISLLILSLLSSIVWDIRIDGNEEITDSEMVCALSECGLSIGDLWSNVNNSKVESMLLKTRDDISWININRRGVVAYIKVIEKDEEYENNTTTLQYANIVASRDCIIEEITVKKGIAMVKPGDVVKKGEVIILGSTSDESGGSFCAAEGIVYGRVTDTLSLEVDRKFQKNINYSKKLYAINLKIFKKNINIFKLYGNLHEECDIIEEKKNYSLFGKHKLPFSLSLKYIPGYETAVIEYSDDEIIKVATDRMSLLMSARLASSDVIRIKTSGNFSSNGYMIRSEYTYIENVGENAEFFIK